MSEAFRKSRDSREQVFRPNIAEPFDSTGVKDDQMKIRQWRDGSRLKLAFAQTEIIQINDGIVIL